MLRNNIPLTIVTKKTSTTEATLLNIGSRQSTTTLGISKGEWDPNIL